MHTRDTPRRVNRITPVNIVASYLTVVLLSFVAMQLAGFDMIAIGAIPVAVLTAPVSVLAIALFSSMMLQPGSGAAHFVNSPSGTFVILVVICGGLNAIMIFAVSSAIQRRREGHRT